MIRNFSPFNFPHIPPPARPEPSFFRPSLLTRINATLDPNARWQVDKLSQQFLVGIFPFPPSSFFLSSLFKSFLLTIFIARGNVALGIEFTKRLFKSEVLDIPPSPEIALRGLLKQGRENAEQWGDGGRVER